MVCREQKRAAMYKKLKLLRSLTHSHAKQSKSSIILDASKYIQELKQKVERINQELVASQNSTAQNPSPVLRVEATENGFLIKVSIGRNYRGLLVYILEAFEELGLDVLQARVSCSDQFYFEAVGAKGNIGAGNIDAQVVKQAVLQAIQNWREITEN